MDMVLFHLDTAEKALVAAYAANERLEAINKERAEILDLPLDEFTDKATYYMKLKAEAEELRKKIMAVLDYADCVNKNVEKFL